MIEFPKPWERIGRKITTDEIERSLEICINTLQVRSLSLSGGIDSTLLLYFMKKMLGDPIHCYTIALDETHPDYLYAKMAADYFGVYFHPQFIREKITGDSAVKLFYAKLSNLGVTDIIAGDGIDEFTCGYYSHQKDPSEQNYISWLRRLRDEQLIPLNKNSGSVNVYLPYLTNSVISLLSLIPIYEKVDGEQRKKLMVEMATNRMPSEIITRWKYGFCDAAILKG